MAEITFEIKKHIGVLGTGARGWTKEVNLISWNNRKPKFDIREWDENHEKMGKGVTLTRSELEQLLEIMKEVDMDELEVE